MLASAEEAAADEGVREAGAALQRLCIVARQVKPTQELIRFVAGPDGTVVADLKRKLPGRGVWVTADRSSIGEAVRRNLFARALKADMKAPPDLPDRVAQLMQRHALDALAIANKAGQVKIGFAKVEATIESGELAGLITASDASLEGRRKLAGTVRRRYGDDGERLPIVCSFTSQQLDLALGRSNVVHAALLAGSASQGFLDRWRRLERFLDSPGPSLDERKTPTRDRADQR